MSLQSPMLVTQRGSKIVIAAPAKLNLFLEVLGRRPDGFHSIETLMTAVSLYDSLRFEATGTGSSIQFSVRAGFGTDRFGDLSSIAPSDENNLVVSALQLLRQRYAISEGARVALIKRIPSAAGMGGASSDAAAALMAGNLGWGVGLGHDQLVELANQVGSDVAFFLHRSPAICRDRGGHVTPCLERCRRHFVVVKPPLHLSTNSVYQRCVVPERPCRIERGTGCGVPRLFNRLQEVAGRITPWIARVQRSFDRLGVGHHQMTGSGSAYFGILRHAGEARRTQGRLRQLGWKEVYCVSTC